MCTKFEATASVLKVLLCLTVGGFVDLSYSGLVAMAWRASGASARPVDLPLPLLQSATSRG